MKRSSVLSITSVLVAAGCQIGVGAPLRSSSRHHAEAAPASPVLAESDDEIARTGIAIILGELDHIDAIGSEDARWTDTRGTFHFTQAEDVAAFRLRIAKLVHEDNVKHELCVRTAILEDAKDEASAAATCKPFQSTRELPVDVYQGGNDPVLRALYLEWLAPAVADPAFVARARERLAASFGFAQKRYGYPIQSRRELGVVQRSYLYEPVAMATWPRHILRGAIRYAKDHGLAAESVAQLEKALEAAPKFRCSWYPEVIAQRSDGTGHFGDSFWANDMIVNANAGVGNGGDIDCNELPKSKTDAGALAVMKRGLAERAGTAMAAVAAGSWEVVTDGLVVIRRTRVIKVYFRDEY